MHVSLDSALGRQRRLNSVGESITQIAPDPAAAYSLRSLTGGDPKVVRVRRDSDNDEQDFTVSEVNSGALVDYVNPQVIKPLDVRELVSGGSDDGRTGDFIIAKAAYSLRSLGDRQATVAATGDTVTAANGKYVVQVRRSSDDTIKSFTADEVTDGTLVAFVGSGNDGFVRTWYDQSVTTQAGDTATGNHAIQATAANQPKVVSNGSLLVDGQSKPAVKFTTSDSSFLVADNFSANQAYSFIFKANAEKTSATQQVIDGDTSTTAFVQIGPDGIIDINNGTAVATSADLDGLPPDFIFTAIINGASSNAFFNGSNVMENQNIGSNNLVGLTLGRHRTADSNYYDNQLSELVVIDSDQTDNRGAFEANMGDHYNISGIPTQENIVNGFVETWYDQSGNGRDLVQTTANNQPKIVDSGSLITNGGILFDGSTSVLPFSSFLDFNSSNAMSIFTAQSVTTNINGHTLGTSNNFGVGISTNRIGFFIAENSPAITYDSVSSTDTSLFVIIHNGTSNDPNLSGFVNGNAGTTTSQGNLLRNRNFQKVGARGPLNNFFSGRIEEIIIYLSDLSSERVDIETNINNHYSIF